MQSCHARACRRRSSPRLSNSPSTGWMTSPDLLGRHSSHLAIPWRAWYVVQYDGCSRSVYGRRHHTTSCLSTPAPPQRSVEMKSGPDASLWSANWSASQPNPFACLPHLLLLTRRPSRAHRDAMTCSSLHDAHEWISLLLCHPGGLMRMPPPADGSESSGMLARCGVRRSSID
jgi:hypothetical protein